MNENLKKMEEFMGLYNRLQMESFLEKKTEGTIESLKEKTNELVEAGLLKKDDFDFTNNENFIKSVSNFAKEMLKKS